MDIAVGVKSTMIVPLDNPESCVTALWGRATASVPLENVISLAENTGSGSAKAAAALVNDRIWMQSANTSKSG